MRWRALARGSLQVGATALSGAGPVFVLLLLGAVWVTLLGALVHWRLVASTSTSIAALVVLVVLVGAGSRTLVGRRSFERDPGTRQTLVASVPGLLVFTAAVVSLAWPLSEGAQWFFGGDHVRHLVFVAQLRRDGVLDYSTNPYPRAWQAFLGLVWSSLGQTSGASGVLVLLRLMSFAVWLLHGLMALTVGQLGASLARRAGLTPRQVGLAGLVAGGVSLWPTFLSNYQVLGFENSIVAVVLLAVAARELLERPSSLQALAVNAGAAAVMAHVWQLLLPVTVLGLVLSGLAVTGRDRRQTRWVILAGGLAGLTAWPGVHAVVSQVGLQSATNASVPSPLPALVFPVSLLAVAFLAVRLRRDRRVLAFGAVVASAIFGAVALAVRVGIPVTEYYPSKMLWTAAVLCLAPLGVATVHLGSRVRSWDGHLARPLRGVLAGAVILLAGYSLMGPFFAVLGPSATADGPTTLGAMMAPEAATADVVWLPRPTAEETRFDSTTARLMLDVYEARRGMSYRDQRSPSVVTECSILAASARPTVLSTAPRAEVASRYSCVPAITVIEAKPYSG